MSSNSEPFGDGALSRGSTPLLALPLAVLVAASAAAQGPGPRDGVPSIEQIQRDLSPDPSPRGIRPAADPWAPPAPRRTTAPPGVPATSFNILFATGSADLTPEAERLLALLGQALVSPVLQAYRFRIEGHTDTVGSPEENLELSERRAASVRDYLIRRFDLPPARLEAVGLGESQLLVRTPDQTPERRNRRVQVVNLGS